MSDGRGSRPPNRCVPVVLGRFCQYTCPFQQSEESGWSWLFKIPASYHQH